MSTSLRAIYDLSIIIVNWNAKDFLVACLESIFAAASGLSLEVIVVDNASEDGSAAAVAQAFPQVRWIENATNRGFAAANNQGIRVSRGRYVLLLNPDTVVRPGALSTLVEFMEAHAEAGACGAKLLNSDGSLQKCVGRFLSLGNEFLEKFVLPRVVKVSRGRYLARAYATAKEVEVVSGACLLLRREALSQVGLLDEAFFLYLEEVDLCLRLAQAQWKTYLVPEAEVVHHLGRSAAKNSHRAALERRRSQLHFYRKHHHGWDVLVIQTLEAVGQARQRLFRRPGSAKVS